MKAFKTFKTFQAFKTFQTFQTSIVLILLLNTITSIEITENINSITLTSNHTFNNIYIEKCNKIKTNISISSGKTYIQNSCYCCQGELYNIICLEKAECDLIISNYDKRFIGIAVSIYISVLLLFSTATGLVFYFLSSKIKSKKVSIMNGLYIFVFIFSIGLGFPIILLVILKVCLKKNISEMFGADFEKFGENYVQHVNVIEGDLEKRFKKKATALYSSEDDLKTAK